VGRDDLEQEAQRRGLNLPVELMDLMVFSYGARFDEYQFLTVGQIVEARQELKGLYGEMWKDHILPIALVLGVGDYVAMDLARSDNGAHLILDGFHEMPPGKWGTICFGLRSWLLRMTQSDFQPFWLEGQAGEG
jgi:hypothetical protein